MHSDLGTFFVDLVLFFIASFDNISYYLRAVYVISLELEIKASGKIYRIILVTVYSHNHNFNDIWDNNINVWTLITLVSISGLFLNIPIFDIAYACYHTIGILPYCAMYILLL